VPYIRRSPIWPDPRVKPPFGAAEVDWSHQLARGLTHLFLFNEGGGSIIDLVAPPRSGGSPPPGMSRVATIFGPAATFANATDRIDLGSGGLAHRNKNLTVLVRVKTLVGAVIRNLGLTGGTGVEAHHCGTNTTPGTWFWAITGVLAINSTINSTAGHYYSAAFAYTRLVGTTFDIVNLTTPSRTIETVAGTNTPGTGQPTSYVAGGANSTQGWFNEFLLFALWSEALPQDALGWLHAEPYAYLRPVVRRRWSVPAAVKFRRSLSAVGARAGARQVVGV
jgi:hypothetical protein